jgi:hypothetical protein
MAPWGDEDGRVAVVETVRRLFTTDDESNDELITGPLLRWRRLRGDDPWVERFEVQGSVDEVEVVELGEARAIVEIRGGYAGRLKRGTFAFRLSFDGPVFLEKSEGRWRVVDYTLEGRRRSQALVFGPLAEQRQQGVTARVLAIDRSAQATELVVELVNETAAQIRLARAFATFETQKSWTGLSLAPSGSIPVGETGTVLINAARAFDLSERGFSLALDVRSEARRYPFVLTVPLTRPPALLTEPPPRLLPLLRWSGPRSLLTLGLATGIAAWLFGWGAVALPILVGGWLYWQLRVLGRLPDDLHRARYLLDALVAAAVFLALWESPAVSVAVPAAVGALVYAALIPLGWRRRDARLVIALSAAATWFYLLGSATGPLSACRLADGRPSSAADNYMVALLTRDTERTHRYESDLIPDLGALLPPPVSRSAAQAAVRVRRDVSEAELCEYLGSDAVGCYAYRVPLEGAIAFTLNVAIGCEERRWKVFYWWPA